MRIGVSRAVQVLLRDSLALRFWVRLRLDFSQNQLDGWVLVVTKHGFIRKTSVDLVDGNGHWLRVVCIELKLAETKASKLMLIRYIVVFSQFVVVADGCDVEEFYILHEADPEAAIVFVLQIYLFFCRFGPLGRLVAPVALPLLLAPGIPDLYDSLSLAVIEGEEFGSNKTVGVCVNQTNSLDTLTRKFCIGLRGHRRAHRIAELVSLEDIIPELIDLFQISVDVEAVWSARYRVQSLASCSCLDTLVTAENLGPGFL